MQIKAPIRRVVKTMSGHLTYISLLKRVAFHVLDWIKVEIICRETILQMILQ